MKCFAKVAGVAATVLLSLSLAAAADEILPGITIPKLPEKLHGRLLFNYGSIATSPSSNLMTSFIYEYQLDKRFLKKIAPSPGGELRASGDGSMICVLHNGGTGYSPAKAYLYSARDQSAWHVDLNAYPVMTAIFGDRAFFMFDSTDKKGLFEYQIAGHRAREIKAPGTESYDRYRALHAHAALEVTNTLHFEADYSLGTGKQSERSIGWFSLEVSTGKVTAIPGRTDSDYFAGYKTSNGRHVFFDGEGSPDMGFSLISADRDARQLRSGGRKSSNIITLKRFAVFPRASSSIYFLSQLSPDREYALVVESSQSSLPEPRHKADFHTYYLVDVTSGKTAVLLKDQVQKETLGFMSGIVWVE